MKNIFLILALLLLAAPAAAQSEASECGNDGPMRGQPCEQSTSSALATGPSKVSTVTAALTAPRRGSSPFNPPEITDSNFVLDAGPGLDTGCTFRSGGPLRIPVKIDRVVGDVQGDQRLADPQTLIQNGVVSKFATLRMPAFDIDYNGAPGFPPERDRVLFNGVDIGPQGGVAYLTGDDGIWKLNEFQIPIELIRFGKRNPGGAPTPGDNVIEIRIDQASGNQENWCMSIDWAAIRFDALAPVIMIHGNNSNGQFFSDFNFIQPFQQQKIPFDNSINMQTDFIAVHGNLLATLIPNKAKEFGARSVHLIAHSKGGLDSRDFLARTLPSNFGVLSLTTLATPHHGSVGADYAIDSKNANSLFSDS
ncbi:MAG: esterase/lipase family protein, partial [Pyrinomonadaceae bacterium]